MERTSPEVTGRSGPPTSTDQDRIITRRLGRTRQAAPDGRALTHPTVKGALPALDAVRALAAIAVVAAHVFQLFALRGVYIGWARPGDVGVYVFFVLSGFLITRSVLQPTRFSTRSYLIRRAARLLPLYYLSLLLSLTLVDPTPLLSAGGRLDVLSHLFLAHGLFRNMRYSINGVYWTLSIEWFFYLLMALVAPLMRSRRGWLMALGMVVLGPVWRATVFFTADKPDFVYFVQQLPGTADLFGMGMAMALVLRWERVGRLLAVPASRVSLLVASSLVTMGALVLYQQRKPVFFDSRFMVIAWPLLLGIGMAGLVGALAVGAPRLNLAARWSGLAYLGIVSYGIYLFHPPVVVALARAWSSPEGGAIPVPLFMVTALVLIILVGVAFHYTVERPFMRRSRMLSSSAPKP